jgi:ATP-binding cassette, subfamily B, multidrug efflux pump
MDEDILGRDPTGLFRTTLLLLAVYVTGLLAQRGQLRQVGAIGQSVLASLRARIPAATSTLVNGPVRRQER